MQQNFREPFSILNQEESSKISKFFIQNAATDDPKAYSNLLESLLESYEIIDEYKFKIIKGQFSDVIDSK